MQMCEYTYIHTCTETYLKELCENACALSVCICVNNFIYSTLIDYL